MGRGDRPEHQAPPEVFYNEDEAHKYTHNSRIIGIQAALTRRALELLALPPGPSQGGSPRLLLDLGCGSGLSGAELSDEGHMWVGVDISEAMLDVALDRECEGDLLLSDLGHGVPLRAGTFDGCVSISAVQWLCNADRSSHDPRKRLRRFFETLYACLARGARAVLQVYPENPAQAEMMVSAAMRAGFSGGLVVDYPHSTKAKKHFLVLMVGTTSALPAARGLGGSGHERDEDVWMGGSEDGAEEEENEEEEEGGPSQVQVGGRDRRKVKAKRGQGGKKQGGGGGKPAKGSREWVLRKKEVARKRGAGNVPQDTKYTGRRRRKLGL